MSDLSPEDGAARPNNSGNSEISSDTGQPSASPPERPKREDAHALTVVGIGASAGGVVALQEFFESAPADTGSAYVVILHLSPDHESQMAEIIGRVTAMPVEQVTHATKLEPNHVYVIPPSRDLSLEDSTLHLSEPDRTRGRRVVIDLFFRTLAGACGPQATAVILSGTGADGTLGLRQIKEAGGLAIAQDPAEAEHDGMPRSAISTGLVDYVLPARDIARQIAAYWDTSRRMRMPEEAAPSPEQVEEGQHQESALRGILGQLRAQTGHDFTYYKRATVLRRVGRRLQVNNLEDLPSYREFLGSHPAEAGDLLADLLISVTQFFRDSEAWQTLERDMVPRLLENRRRPGAGPEDAVRAWVCGCATGEEAYSLAILLAEEAERQERQGRPPAFQVFATDMDLDALAYARAGVYPDTIAADVSPERLRRWFTPEHGSNHGSGNGNGVNGAGGIRYRIRQELRERVLFAPHDVLRDTPFSRLDLITCRNLLIYLTREAQERVFELFHFALRPDARLFLGSAEAVDGGAGALFAAADKQNRLYVRRPVARPIPSIPTAATAVSHPPQFPRPTPPPLPSAFGGGESRVEGDDTGAQQPIHPERSPASIGDLHQSLLARYAPPSILVSQDHQVLHVSGGAGRYLEVAEGEPTTQLLQMLHPGLRLEVSAALYAAAAAEEGEQVRLARHAPGGGVVRVTVRPVLEPEGARGYLLVTLDEAPAPATSPPPDSPALSQQGAQGAEEAGTPQTTRQTPQNMPQESGAASYQLEQEIARLRLHMRSMAERYEASSEELKASNEELQAINEELRSATEELETSKEELQSLNEELSTVNHELKARMDEVGRVNGDLQNFLSSTNIATIFLDRGLCVQRYTPAADSLFNIIPTDVGRPFAHLTHRLDTDALPGDADQVLESLTPSEREVRCATDGRHFLARIRPYRTPEDKIDGVVLAFIDITERKQAEEALDRTHDEMETRVIERTAQLADMSKRRGELVRLLVTAQEDERRRISRELHDDLGQELTTLMMALGSLRDAPAIPSSARESLSRLRQTADGLAHKLHTLAVALRPTALDDVGLSGALRAHLEQWSGRSGIAAELEDTGFGDERLPPEVETVVYRVVQEALTNVSKHALGAEAVGILLQRREDEVIVMVEDDGAGFDPEVDPESESTPPPTASGRQRLGLVGMRERAALVGGTLSIESTPGQGTTVYLRIPITPTAAGIRIPPEDMSDQADQADEEDQANSPL
jgi:two-component system CheB/CheR fusion protein